MRTTSEVMFKAPGRICLFGDHQDYLGLPIIACAIDLFIEFSAISNESEMFSNQFGLKEVPLVTDCHSVDEGTSNVRIRLTV